MNTSNLKHSSFKHRISSTPYAFRLAGNNNRRGNKSSKVITFIAKPDDKVSHVKYVTFLNENGVLETSKIRFIDKVIRIVDDTMKPYRVRKANATKEQLKEYQTLGIKQVASNCIKLTVAAGERQRKIDSESGFLDILMG